MEHLQIATIMEKKADTSAEITAVNTNVGIMVMGISADIINKFYQI